MKAADAFYVYMYLCTIRICTYSVIALYIFDHYEILKFLPNYLTEGGTLSLIPGNIPLITFAHWYNLNFFLYLEHLCHNKRSLHNRAVKKRLLGVAVLKRDSLMSSSAPASSGEPIRNIKFVKNFETNWNRRKWEAILTISWWSSFTASGIGLNVWEKP